MTNAKTPMATEAASTGVRWQATAPLGTFTSLVLLHAMSDCYGGFWPIFKNLANLDLGWAGLIASVTTIVAMGSQPFFGIWADRGYRRRFILLGAALGTLGMLIGPLQLYQNQLGEVVTYLLMFVMLMVVHMGQAMFHPAGASVAGDLAAHKRSTLVALFIAGGMFGFGFSHLLYASVYQKTGGHTQWLLLPAAGVILWGFVYCRPTESPSHQRPHLRDIFAAMMKQRGTLVPLYFMLAMSSAQTIGLIFLLPEFVEFRGYPLWLVNGGAFGLMIGGSVLLMVPVGHLADRFGRRRMMVLMLVLALISYYVLLLSPTLPVWVFALVCLAAGGLMGTANPLGVSLAQHLMPQSASLISGVMMGLAWAFGGFGPVIVGFLAKAPSIGLLATRLWWGATGAVAVVLMLFLGRSSRGAT
jgi:FSR family fosmidomycin resistance protein-like MFS transporter